jgi:hypothetical protein
MTGRDVSDDVMSNFPRRASGNVPPVADGELDELLTAAQPPQHVAPALQPVAELLAALQAGPADSELAGKASTLAAFRGAGGQQQRERHVPARKSALLRALLRARLAAAVAGAAAIAVGGTAAAAYAGALPASLQRVAHIVIAAPAVRSDPGAQAARRTGHSAPHHRTAAPDRDTAASHVAGGHGAPRGGHARPAGHHALPGRHDTWPGKHHGWPGGHNPWPGQHEGWPGLPGVGAGHPHEKPVAHQPGDASATAAKLAVHLPADAVRDAAQLTHFTGKPTRVPAPGARRHPQFRPRL